MDVEVILQKGAAAWCKEPEERVFHMMEEECSI